MNKWVFVILLWWVLQILVILSPPQGLKGTITKALVPCLEQSGEKEILNRSSLMVQTQCSGCIRSCLRLLTPQICWQKSTSSCFCLQKWSDLVGAQICLTFIYIYTQKETTNHRSFDRTCVKKLLQMELFWQIRKCGHMLGRDGVVSSWQEDQGSRLLLGTSCDQNTPDPAPLECHPQPHVVHAVASPRAK